MVQLDNLFELDADASRLISRLRTEHGLSEWAVWRWFYAMNPWDGRRRPKCPKARRCRTSSPTASSLANGRRASTSHATTPRITGCAQYNFFPNATVLAWSDMVNILSTRPGLTPDACQFVITNFHRVPSGAPRSEPFTIGPDGPELPLGLVMSQDIGIMQTAQRGLHQPGLIHLTVSAEECRVINLHTNLEERCG